MPYKIKVLTNSTSEYNKRFIAFETDTYELREGMVLFVDKIYNKERAFSTTVCEIEEVK